MQLSKNLLFSEEEFNYNSILNGTSIKGSYNTLQFVLRLRDDIKTALRNKEFESERIQAFSTSIHENIHWWQHIGSNFGFLFNLAYPAFAHFAKENLDKLVVSGIKCKSLIKFDTQYFEKNGKADISDVNTILNTYYDIENAKLYALDNKNIFKIIEDKRFFLNIGHCYGILWSMTFSLIASVVDPKYTFLQNPKKWATNFKKLSENNTPGFNSNSPIVISTLGVKAIFEGQAIFNQMQYLTVTLNPELTYSDFEQVGMLHGVYIEAFDNFLSITKLEKPTNLLDPTVGLFLIVCDLSINSNNGFPNEIYDYENFITKNDPGMRFSLICLNIAKNAIDFRNKIKCYSKEEYILLSKELCESIGCKCSYESISTVLNWAKKESVIQILIEEQELKFSKDNLPIRLLFSKYLRFQEDKFKYPNVFCWFGLHAKSGSPNIDFKVVNSLYLKHHALFIEDYDGEIKPVIFEGRSEENIIETFNAFYNFTILYDLILKWIYEEGEFNLNYKWLVNKRAEEFKPIIDNEFNKLFGISIYDINIL